MAGSEPQFSFFVVQTRMERQGTDVAVSGVLENLGTGEKRSFASSEQLNLLLREWGSRPEDSDTQYAPPGREVEP